jgi:Fe-S-cluster containining protein
MFNCTKCGACCRKAADLFKEFDIEFPFGYKEDGNTCEKFEEGIGCTVYNDRPDVCRTDIAAKFYKKEFGIKKNEFHKLASQQCNELMNELNIDQSFRIKI